MIQNARTQAVQLLKKSNAFCTPVDLEAVAKFLDIKILYENFDNEISGLLVVKDGRRAIGVNKNHGINRQRFTIAHEIGHFVLHHSTKNDVQHVDTKSAYFRSTAHSTEHLQEQQANRFAAELLMPQELLESAIKKYKLDLTDDLHISKLANLLQVSEQALTIRLVGLRLIEPY